MVQKTRQRYPKGVQLRVKNTQEDFTGKMAGMLNSNERDKLATKEGKVQVYIIKRGMRQ